MRPRNVDRLFDDRRCLWRQAVPIEISGIERIFTRREYRGRGIASALIGRNLRVLRARGMTEAALSTDSDNPSGALDLYERHGFRRDRVEVGWERPV